MSELTGADDGTVPQRPPPSSPRRERRTDGPRGSLRPASEERNETRVGGRKKKKGRERKNTGTTREPTTGTDRTDPRKSGKPAARVGPPRAPRGGSRHPPPHTTAASGTAAAGGGGSWSLRESRPNDRLPYGPHRPPTLGAAGRPPPGVFKPPRRNATARYPGQERGGHARPEKRGIGTGEPTRDTHIPPHATTAPANVEKPEPRRGWVPGEQSARPDDRTPPGRVKNP